MGILVMNQDKVTVRLRRHGDVLIKTTQGFKVPKGTKLKSMKIVHKGANHDHFISKGEVKISAEVDGKRFMKVVKSAVISHGRGKSSEHASKPIPKGDYWIEIQTEYDHLLEEARKVID
jgi:ribosome-associated protein YbcJ (S4-like RNA binding protein)